MKSTLKVICYIFDIYHYFSFVYHYNSLRLILKLITLRLPTSSFQNLPEFYTEFLIHVLQRKTHFIALMWEEDTYKAAMGGLKNASQG